MLANFQIESDVHVHGDDFYPSTAFLAQQLEKWADRLPAVAVADLQDTHCLGIHQDGRVTMAFVQGELIHDQPTLAAPFEGDEFALQARLVDLFDRVLVQSGQLGDMSNRKQFSQGFDPGAKAFGQAGMPVQPPNPLDQPRAAVMTVHPPHGDAQPDPAIESVTFAHPSPPSLAKQRTGLALYPA